MPNSTLHDLIEHGAIGPVHCAGQEILRRIFVTCRDRNWQEVAPTEWTSQIDEARGIALLSARHQSALVDFEWLGTLHVRDDLRALRFAFEGRVLRDMEVCRLGLVVLHPVAPLLGARVVAEGPQGRQSLTVPARLHPQPIVNGIPGAMTEPFSQLTIEREDLGTLELRFEGELFELEDQRNWGDASFKSYCTPLRLGFPRAVMAGTSIAHGVELRFTPQSVQAAGRSQNKHRASYADREDAASVIPNGDQVAAGEGRFPAIGREWRASSSGAAPEASGLPWDYLHLDITSAEGAAALPARLASWSAKIEIALAIDDEEMSSLDRLALLATHRTQIVRVLLSGPGTTLPTTAMIERCRARLDELGCATVPLLAATRGYFVEYNRAVPFDLPVSGIASPLTATVHADDRRTIADNVATIRDMAETARHVTQHSHLVLAPLALYYPAASKPQGFPNELVAPWLAATLIHAATAPVASVTLAEDILHALAALAPERSSHFLRSLIACSRQQVLPFDGPLPPDVHALQRERTQHAPTRLLVANLAARPAHLSLEGRALRAMKASDAITGAPLATSGALITVPAFGVAWVEGMG